MKQRGADDGRTNTAQGGQLSSELDLAEALLRPVRPAVVVLSPLLRSLAASSSIQSPAHRSTGSVPYPETHVTVNVRLTCSQCSRLS
jgi:hypothetical protein